jgi:hypothetical protein
MSTSGTVTREDQFLAMGLRGVLPATSPGMTARSSAAQSAASSAGAGATDQPMPFQAAAEDVSMYRYVARGGGSGERKKKKKKKKKISQRP